MRFLVILVLCRLSLQAEDTGFPAGLMADCPGMNRTTLLSKETKSSLSVVVVYPSSGLLGHREMRCKLSEEGAACAVKHIDLKRRKTQQICIRTIKTVSNYEETTMYEVNSRIYGYFSKGGKFAFISQVLISGYMDASFSPLVRSFIAQYLSLGRNVIVLEIFPVLVRTYPIAARITKPLGELLGQFMASLTSRGLSSRRIELVGASLGAHIASHAAVTYYQLTGRRPARLTGLDPAGPCFRNVPPTARLHAGAAHRVDVLHTNIDGFGIAEPVGHVDFYANGGEFQPAIKGNFIMPCFQLCSHVRAAFYWLLSYTNPDKFVAVRCDSVADVRHGKCYDGEIKTNVLGPKTNFNKTGVFYLPTDAMSPYYLGLNGLKERKFGVNDYLIKPAPDKDLTV